MAKNIHALRETVENAGNFFTYRKFDECLKTCTKGFEIARNGVGDKTRCVLSENGRFLTGQP